MNSQFIQGILFDWNKIERHSYLKKIEAFRGMERIDFTNPITFFDCYPFADTVRNSRHRDLLL